QSSSLRPSLQAPHLFFQRHKKRSQFEAIFFARTACALVASKPVVLGASVRSLHLRFFSSIWLVPSWAAPSFLQSPWPLQTNCPGPDQKRLTAQTIADGTLDKIVNELRGRGCILFLK